MEEGIPNRNSMDEGIPNRNSMEEGITNRNKIYIRPIILSEQSMIFDIFRSHIMYKYLIFISLFAPQITDLTFLAIVSLISDF